MPFDFDTPKTFFEKGAKAVDWVAEEIIRQKNWRSLLVLIDVVLFLALNPFEWPFPNLLSLFPQLKQFGWYAPVFWSLIGAIFIIAVIVTARAKRKPAGPAELKLGAIKGLLPFGYEDAEVFSHLQRDQSLKECLQAIGDEQWRFGVLSGESGAGKTSFLQAGLWPELEKRKFRCVYVKFSDLDPFESVKRACLKHLSFADGAPDGADFQGLLRAAVAQDRTPVVFFFDQFEQFFVHRKRKKDREPFAQALAQWFAEMESLPIKILICVRGDFFDRLNELQKAMRYSLSPTQSFRLERFEPDQATEVFCFLAEKEGLEYDRKFISEMTRQELADTEDGLISPVDVQVLARMIERQTAQGARAFNRATFQKLGGVEGLLERYMTTALEPLGSQSRRQAAIKVLLALTDLERNARAGALTLEDLRQKLDDIADSELKDAVAYLLLGDVRLISPSSENEEEKFELAHERLIPALRRLAGKQLGEADRADQLLDRRTNEWLGNGRSSRYLFSWSELRLINKHKRFVTWGKQRQAKEDLLAASRRDFRWRYAVIGAVIPLFLLLLIGEKSNAWQSALIKNDLHSYSARLDDDDTLYDIARAFAYAGDLQPALQIVDRMNGDGYKALALIEVAESSVRLGDKEKASALLLDSVKMAERINHDNYKEYTLDELREYKVKSLIAITESYARLGDKQKASALLSEAVNTAEPMGANHTKTSVLGAIIKSYAKIGETTKDSAFLEEAVKMTVRMTERFSDNSYYRAGVWGAIIRSYTSLAETMKDSALLEKAIKATERINAESINKDSYKFYDLSAIAQSYAKLGDKDKARALLSEAIRAIGNASAKTLPLNAIINSYVGVGEILKDSALLEEAIKTASLISHYKPKTDALRTIAMSIARLGDKDKARTLLSEAVEAAERISSDGSKDSSLNAIADSYARIGEIMKDSALLEEAIKTAERISNAQVKVHALSATAESYARLGNKDKAREMLAKMTKTAALIEFARFKAFVLNAIAISYARVGETIKDSALLSEAIETARSITDNELQASALSEIVRSQAKLAESSNDPASYDQTFRLIAWPISDHEKNRVLEAILSSKLAIADVGRLRSLIPRFSDERAKVRALASILKACSRPELIGKKSDEEQRLVSSEDR